MDRGLVPSCEMYGVRLVVDRWVDRLPAGVEIRQAANGRYYAIDAATDEYMVADAPNWLAAWTAVRAVVDAGWPIDRRAGYPGAARQ